MKTKQDTTFPPMKEAVFDVRFNCAFCLGGDLCVYCVRLACERCHAWKIDQTIGGICKDYSRQRGQALER